MDALSELRQDWWPRSAEDRPSLLDDRSPNEPAGELHESEDRFPPAKPYHRRLLAALRDGSWGIPELMSDPRFLQGIAVMREESGSADWQWCRQKRFQVRWIDRERGRAYTEAIFLHSPDSLRKYESVVGGPGSLQKISAAKDSSMFWSLVIFTKLLSESGARSWDQQLRQLKNELRKTRSSAL